MNYCLKRLPIHLFLFSLSACNNQTDSNGDQAKTSIADGELKVISKSNHPVDYSSVQENTASQENNENTGNAQPVALDEFRHAIDEVVQESIQEAVEKAVQDEVARQAQKKQ